MSTHLSADTTLVSRSECGLRSPTSITPFTPSFGTTVHYNGPPIGLQRLMPNHSACLSTWRGIQAFHMGGDRGWTDIAYTAGACPHGFILEGRWVGRRTAAQGTNEGNDTAYAIMALLGEGEAPPEAMKRAIADACAWLREHGHAGGSVNSHRQWHSTACPGDPLAAWVADGIPRPDVWPSPFPIKPGDEGFAVLLLEIILVHCGQTEVLVDGSFGGNTLEAVHHMQRLLSLGQRDLVREKDFEAMNNWSKLVAEPDRPKTINDRGPRIEQLNEDLRVMGKVVPNGATFTTQTRDAMRDVQRFFDGPTKAGNATVEDMKFVHLLRTTPR